MDQQIKPYYHYCKMLHTPVEPTQQLDLSILKRKKKNITYNKTKISTTLKGTRRVVLKELGHLEKMWAKSVDLRGYVKKYHISPCHIDGVKDVWRFKVELDTSNFDKI